MQDTLLWLKLVGGLLTGGAAGLRGCLCAASSANAASFSARCRCSAAWCAARCAAAAASASSSRNLLTRDRAASVGCSGTPPGGTCSVTSVGSDWAAAALAPLQSARPCEIACCVQKQQHFHQANCRLWMTIGLKHVLAPHGKSAFPCDAGRQRRHPLQWC